MDMVDKNLTLREMKAREKMTAESHDVDGATSGGPRMSVSEDQVMGDSESHGVRPTGSALMPHSSTGAPRIPTAEKGKGGKGKSSKRRRVRTPPMIEVTEADTGGEDHSDEHAGWFAGIVCTGDKFPPLNELDRKEEFVDMAHAAAKWVAKSNRVTLRYQDDLSKMRAELDIARARISELEASAIPKEQEEEWKDELNRLRTEVKFLKSQARSLKGAATKARKAERALVVKNYQERDSTLASNAAALKGKLALDMMYQGQTKSNQELVAELRAPMPRSLDEIDAELSSWSLEYAGAQTRFDDAVDDLVMGFGGSMNLAEIEPGESTMEEAATGDDDDA